MIEVFGQSNDLLYLGTVHVIIDSTSLVPMLLASFKVFIWSRHWRIWVSKTCSLKYAVTWKSFHFTHRIISSFHMLHGVPSVRAPHTSRCILFAVQIYIIEYNKCFTTIMHTWPFQMEQSAVFFNYAHVLLISWKSSEKWNLRFQLSRHKQSFPRFFTFLISRAVRCFSRFRCGRRPERYVIEVFKHTKYRDSNDRFHWKRVCYTRLVNKTFLHTQFHESLCWLELPPEQKREAS